MTTRLFYIKCSRPRLLPVGRYLNNNTHRCWISYLLHGKNAWDRCLCRARTQGGREGGRGRGANDTRIQSGRRMKHRGCQVPGVPRGLFSIAVFPRMPVHRHPGAGRPRMSCIFSDHTTACGAPPRRFDTARNKMFIEPLDRNRFPRV